MFDSSRSTCTHTSSLDCKNYYAIRFWGQRNENVTVPLFVSRWWCTFGWFHSLTRTVLSQMFFYSFRTNLFFLLSVPMHSRSRRRRRSQGKLMGTPCTLADTHTHTHELTQGTDCKYREKGIFRFSYAKLLTGFTIF